MSAEATAAVTPAGAPHADTPPDERLSKDFTRLWVAAIASNLADGVGRVAVPLLAALITRDPAAMAFLGALGVVPWLAFGIYSGVLVDRVDRRKAMAAANALRLVSAGLLAAVVLADQISLPVLALVVLAFGTGETLFDNATNAVIPSVVRPSLRDKANGRIQAAQVAVDLFVATPLGGVLFAASAVVPLVVAGGGYGVAAALALALPAVAARAATGRGGVAADAPDGAGAPGSSDVAQTPDPAETPDAAPASASKPTARDGIRYLWSHDYLRRMTLMTSLVAALLTFAQATSVLLFLDHYGVKPAFFGVVTAAIGVGGLGGSLIAASLVTRWGRGRVMLGATIVGGLGLAAVATSPSVWLAGAAYGVGAAGVSAWNVPWASARQSLIPGHLMGRVIGFARTIAWGLIPVATVAGGFVGRVSLQLTFALGGIGTVVVALWGARLILSTDRQAPVED